MHVHTAARVDAWIGNPTQFLTFKFFLRGSDREWDVELEQQESSM